MPCIYIYIYIYTRIYFFKLTIQSIWIMYVCSKVVLMFTETVSRVYLRKIEQIRFTFKLSRSSFDANTGQL